VSSSDAGRRCRISVSTGCPVESELPRSPLREVAQVERELVREALVQAEAARICSIASVVAEGRRNRPPDRPAARASAGT
jgi:hypothetical protein